MYGYGWIWSCLQKLWIWMDLELPSETMDMDGFGAAFRNYGYG
jgi:hypothetical protein